MATVISLTSVRLKRFLDGELKYITMWGYYCTALSLIFTVSVVDRISLNYISKN